MDEVRASYYDGLTARSQPVRLSLHGKLLTVSGDFLTREEPLSSLEISEPMGDAPRIVRFTDGAHCEVIDHAAFARLLRDAGISDGLVVRMQARWQWAVIAVLLTVITAAAGYRWGLPAAADWIAERLPDSLLAGMGETTLEILDEHVFGPSQLSSKRQEGIVRSFARLRVPTGSLPAYSIEFRDGGRIGANAFALPDGTIIVTDQLAEIAGDDEEILSVLAHEAGHLERRHSLRMLIQGSIVGFVVGWYLGDVSSVAAGLPSAILQARYSREFEREADRFAMQMLELNDIPPVALARILQRMQADMHCAISGDTPGNPFGDYLGSHPATSERISALAGDQALVAEIVDSACITPLDDAGIEEIMPGSWVISPDDPDHEYGGVIGEYRADGTKQTVFYETNKCENRVATTQSRWWIENGYLYTQVETSDRPDVFDEGELFKDRVVSIDSRQAVLFSEDGYRLYRTRSNRCLNE